VLMPPVPQLLGDRTGRVAICRPTANRNKTIQSAASDQASHEVARMLIPLAPCSSAWFPRSRHYFTELPSPKRYGKRYENEMPVMKAARIERHRRRNLRSTPRQRWKQHQVASRRQVPVLAPRKWTYSRPCTKANGFRRPVCWGKRTSAPWSSYFHASWLVPAEDSSLASRLWLLL
jgi:hypothetical protein